MNTVSVSTKILFFDHKSVHCIYLGNYISYCLSLGAGVYEIDLYGMGRLLRTTQYTFTDGEVSED